MRGTQRAVSFLSMWTYKPEYLGESVPRYTSYPTAAEFGTGVGEAAQAEALDGVATDEALSLYLHVPFCERICWYCGCNTNAANSPERVLEYAGLLAAEISTISDRLEGRGRVTGIHFGGGSPNALSAPTLAMIAGGLRRAFRIEADAEWAAELDPGTLSPAYVSAVAAMGFNRVSLGVQTFAPRIQARIGRVQPESEIRETVRRLRSAGIGRINFDLMYGLPDQREQDVVETILKAAELRPSRIALFGYAHLPSAIPRQRRIETAALPTAAERFAQAEAAHAALLSAGYVEIGFDHFALPDDTLATAARKGTLRRNFQGFTDDPADTLIGLGATAISSFHDRYVQNAKSIADYRARIAEGRLAGERGVWRSEGDRFRGAVISSILCYGVADIDRMAGEAEVDPAAFDAEVRSLAPLAGAGIVRIHGRQIAVTGAGVPYRRVVASAFDEYRHGHGPSRFSSAV